MTDTSNRGLGSDNISDDEKHRIQSMGGQASGGNFAHDPKRASREGKRGAAAQPTEAKRRGGEHSHQND